MNIDYRQIQGFCDFHNLYNEIAHQLEDGDEIAEVGVLYGHSVAYMCDCLKKMNKRVKIYATDLWDNVGVPEFNSENDKILSEQFGYDYRKKFETNPNIFYEKFISNMTLANCMDYVVPMKMTSTQGASLLKDKSLKFCFIDANHTYNSVIEDINAYKPKIIDGCIMAGHDYYWDGVKKAVDESFKNINVMGTSWWTVIN